jgi:hypothetical protein
VQRKVNQLYEILKTRHLVEQSIPNSTIVRTSFPIYFGVISSINVVKRIGEGECEFMASKIMLG